MEIQTARKALELMIMTLFYLLYYYRANGNFQQVYYINQFIRRNSSLLSMNDFTRLFKLFVHKESHLDMVAEVYYLIGVYYKFSIRKKSTRLLFLNDLGKISKYNNLDNQGTPYNSFFSENWKYPKHILLLFV